MGVREIILRPLCGRDSELEDDVACVFHTVLVGNHSLITSVCEGLGAVVPLQR